MSTKLPKLVIKKAAFRKWLEERADIVVGLTDMKAQCPIHTYLTSTKGWAYVRVWHTQVQTAGLFLTLPKWAQKFIEDIDSPKRRVTGAECLEVLDGGISLYHRENGIGYTNHVKVS